MDRACFGAILRHDVSASRRSAFPVMTSLIAIVLLIAAVPLCAQAEELGLRVPAGFSVSVYADDTLAHDIYSMTLDAQGRVVVAGAGYVKTLHDDDGDGRADRATLFSAVPKSGARGMFFDGADLVCTGDGGVLRFSDRNGDGAADGEPEVWTHLEHPEHGANGLVRGPDGCYYLICGNDAGINAEHAVLPTSPVKRPHSGGIVRFSPRGRVLDVYAHGFRNPYDLTIDARGRVLAVDSDGERDHHLPWYAPTRLFDVAQGQEHGWLLKGWTQTWNRPESFFDNVERAAEMGRGSPTGIETYRHRQFPARYRGGVFAACWTFGRVYYLPLVESGASCTAQAETFLETTGDVGFAPCDLAVGPDGDLFVAIGGRRTRGSVFRVRYGGPPPPALAGEPLTRVLDADQPLASWSRARWVPLAQQLGRQAFQAAACDEKRPDRERIRAIEVLVELFDGLEAASFQACATSAKAQVRARTAWAAGRSPVSKHATEAACRLTSDDDPHVQRFAWEALATMPPVDPHQLPQPDWQRGLAHELRRVRSAAIAAASRAGQASYRTFASRVGATADSAVKLAAFWIDRASRDTSEVANFAQDELAMLSRLAAATDRPIKERLEATRLLQLALGDVRLADGRAEVYSGYQAQADAGSVAAHRATLGGTLAAAFPSSDAELDRELARLLGMLASNDAGLPAKLAAKWTSTSTVEDDIHYLIVSSLIPAPRDAAVTRSTADCLLGLHGKLAASGAFASRNWPLRLAETCVELYRRDPALPEAIATSEHLGASGHTLFAGTLPAAQRLPAIRKLVAAAKADPEATTPEMVALAAELPPKESLPWLRAQWEHAALRDAVVLALARNPEPIDREKFVAALASPQPPVVEQAARALFAFGVRCTPAELAAAMVALKTACGQPKQTEPRMTLVHLLEHWTEDGADVERDPDPSRQWVGWFEVLSQYYPAEYARLAGRTTGSLSDWRPRLAGVDWSAGDVHAGKRIFELRSCHRCHQVSGHLGPELKGAVTRLSREDLLAAIIDPNLEVAPAYTTTQVATADGQVYHGIVVYESPEGTLLQTGPDTTVRILSSDTRSMRPSGRSLMPTGLVDSLSDQELADLYAYLKSLSTD